ncbi:MAG TPA: carboxypeptidase-like regulatory domain-containing protein [Ferruginibacter sp.]|nr:carboxypeptidase-like regulatory domain-containing protein [Ferruginibacter sp.]
MKKLTVFTALLISTFTAAAQNNSFTQTIKGIVIDEQSGNSLEGVTIAIENNNINSISDNRGTFVLQQVPIGRQNLKASISGYEEAFVANIEVTSSKEVMIEIKLKEKVQKMDELVMKSGRSKTKALNEAAVVSARQLSVDEAFKYAGTRSDPSRMAQNFAGVSGTNDGRNDIIIRGNSPAGVLWRMDGIDIPNPNHFSTLGATGGPVSILNINTLKNSDFLTSAFPSQYGNAIAGVFDLRLRNGNADKTEFTGQMGFNGFEFAAEGPVSKSSKSSYLIDYRYSMVAALQNLGLNFGTGSATPYYQDLTFKINLPTKKAGTFSIFGLGGESHIHFLPESQGKDNLYSSNDGTQRDRNFKSLTGVVGMNHLYFYNTNTSAKTTFAVSGFSSKYDEAIVEENKANKPAFYRKNDIVKYSLSHTFNKKINSKNQFTAGVVADVNKVKLYQDYIKNGDSVLSNLLDVNETAVLLKGFASIGHRFSDKLSTNLGVYVQDFTVNNSISIEPRWNIRYQLKTNQSLSFGAGLHSQTQPLEVYFFQSRDNNGNRLLTNKELDFVKSIHSALGYDINVSRYFRLKTEFYGQYIYNAAVEKTVSSFSMLNAGSDFGFPDKTDLVNNGKGYNYGVEITAERFLHKGFYYLLTVSLFESKYKGSDNVWRNTAFNSNYVVNVLGGKEWRLNAKTTFGIDTKLTVTGGQRYKPFDVAASKNEGYIVYKEDEAYSLQNETYLRFDLKFSYVRNLKKVTQKWYIDLQNLTNRENIYIRTLNPKTGMESRINQMGLFPNINYQITF